MKIEAVMAPKQAMKLDFKDGSKHFVLLVRREGEAKGTGPLAGGQVVEFGMHDINPGVGGDPRGFLEITTPSGDHAYIRWIVKAVFVKGDGKPRLIDYGHWELISGSGVLANMRGVGTMTIKAASKTDRLFTLEGEIAPKP
ncbi:MAG: hypothetical protein HQ481_09725 [Alphaproteobacteria bacterium]|nr:hypothetical protein [Alphaproteobacteria bacterium]